jgi:hypothetical protein
MGPAQCHCIFKYNTPEEVNHMRIQELMENPTGHSRRQPLTAEQVVQMLPDYAHAWQKYLAGDAVYRGVSRDVGHGGRSWIDPRSRPRPSANTSNLYTLFVDSDPRWDNYPDRSRSLICTNTWRTAKSYGDPHVVLLKNHSRIGICSEGDWWLSFGHLMAELRRYQNSSIYDMSDLNKILADAYKTVFAQEISLHSADTLTADLDRLGTHLREHDLDYWASLGRKEEYVFGQSGLFKLFLSQDASMTELLSQLLDPAANDFSVTTVEAYQQPEDERELWSDGTALMLDLAAVEQLKTDLGVG